jgi:hypothetical protein
MLAHQLLKQVKHDCYVKIYESKSFFLPVIYCQYCDDLLFDLAFSLIIGYYFIPR